MKETRKIIEDYFEEVFEKYKNKIKKSELEQNGTIYYMNGNDTTDFDWYANHRLCELQVYYKNAWGCIKLLICDTGLMEGYVWLDEGKAPVIRLPDKRISELMAKKMYQIFSSKADKRMIFDAPICDILKEDANVRRTSTDK